MLGLILGFIVAASLGAFARWGVGHVLPPNYSTLFVNIVGSFLLGFLFIYLQRFSEPLKVMVWVALLGAFTTYSGFALDLVRLLNQGAIKTALLYFIASNGLAVLACYAGWQVANLLERSI
ncbi:MAG: CrcB family protein [Bdellovibrionales bacterium]|nr:CrcB family protein [Bdellovibrionales bacterium]